MIHLGDLFDVLPTLDADSIDAAVTDPPYGIGFMGKEWDTFTPDVVAKSAASGLRPHPIVSDNPNIHGRTRSPAISPSQIGYNRTLEGQRDFQAWCERWAREVFRVLKPGAYLIVCGAPRSFHRMTCGLEDAGFEIRDCLSWLYGSGFPKSLNIGDGRGTALKPGWEPCVLARKPFPGTVAANVVTHGTGALNIDGCRIDLHGGTTTSGDDSVGRWPANVALDDAAAAMLDEQSGDLVNGYRANPSTQSGSAFHSNAGVGERGHDDTGGASRFFYVAKPSREERDYGCTDLPTHSGGSATDRMDGSPGVNSPRAGAGRTGGSRNVHPTVKPIALMRWLIRLITPPGGTVLDPFTGSGTTGMACRYEQRGFIGIEREATYKAIAEKRIAAVVPLFHMTQEMGK